MGYNLELNPHEGRLASWRVGSPVSNFFFLWFAF